MNCVKCNRPLKSPKAMAAGIGPVCLRKALAAMAGAGNDGAIPLDWVAAGKANAERHAAAVAASNEAVANG